MSYVDQIYNDVDKLLAKIQGRASLTKKRRWLGACKNMIATGIKDGVELTELAQLIHRIERVEVWIKE